MRITNIEFEGRAGYYATAQYTLGNLGKSDFIYISVLTEAQPNGLNFIVRVDDPIEVLQQAAEQVAIELEGSAGLSKEYFTKLSLLLSKQ